MVRVDQWEESVGFLPHKVTVYEEQARKGVLYLRWRQDGNWKTPHTEHGRSRTRTGDFLLVRQAL